MPANTRNQPQPCYFISQWGIRLLSPTTNRVYNFLASAVSGKTEWRSSTSSHLAVMGNILQNVRETIWGSLTSILVNQEEGSTLPSQKSPRRSSGKLTLPCVPRPLTIAASMEAMREQWPGTAFPPPDREVSERPFVELRVYNICLACMKPWGGVERENRQGISARNKAFKM